MMAVFFSFLNTRYGLDVDELWTNPVDLEKESGLVLLEKRLRARGVSVAQAHLRFVHAFNVAHEPSLIEDIRTLFPTVEDLPVMKVKKEGKTAEVRNGLVHSSWGTAEAPFTSPLKREFTGVLNTGAGGSILLSCADSMEGLPAASQVLVGIDDQRLRIQSEIYKKLPDRDWELIPKRGVRLTDSHPLGDRRAYYLGELEEFLGAQIALSFSNPAIVTRADGTHREPENVISRLDIEFFVDTNEECGESVPTIEEMLGFSVAGDYERIWCAEEVCARAYRESKDKSVIFDEDLGTASVSSNGRVATITEFYRDGTNWTHQVWRNCRRRRVSGEDGKVKTLGEWSFYPRGRFGSGCFGGVMIEGLVGSTRIGGNPASFGRVGAGECEE